MLITPNFSTSEMACSHCQKADMDEEFMRVLQSIRDEIQRPLKITSGFRCEKHNAKVSSTGKNGPHTFGKAADVLISGADAMRLYDIARKHGVSGIGMSQKGAHSKRFVHLDTLSPDEGPRPTISTY